MTKDTSDVVALPAPDWYSDGFQIQSQPFNHNGFQAAPLYTPATVEALISSLVAERDELAAMTQRLVAAGNEDVALMREMGETITSAQDRALTAERLLAEARAEASHAK